MFLSNNKLNTNESNIVLETLIGFLADGQTVLKSLEYAGELFGGKIKHITDLIHDDVIESSIATSESLFMHGVLTEEESSLFAEQSGKVKESVEEIIRLRKYGSQYEKIIWDGLKSTLFLFILSSAIMFFFADSLTAQILQVIKDSATAEVKTIDEMDVLPLFLSNKWILIYQIIAVLGGGSLVVMIYNWYYNNNRKVIYKLFKKKAYDDIPRLFQIMSKMKISGRYNTIDIFNHMGNSKSYKGLAQLFYSLHEASLSKDELYPHFKAAGFPKDIVLLIHAKEDTDFWRGISSLIKFAQDRAEVEYTKMRGIFSLVSMVLPWIYPTYLMMAISFVYMGAQNIG